MLSKVAMLRASPATIRGGAVNAVAAPVAANSTVWVRNLATKGKGPVIGIVRLLLSPQHHSRVCMN